MSQTIEVDGIVYRTGPQHAIDISIPLRFGGPQPNAFGVEPAVSQPCEYGTLVGDTRRGGSCNFEQITLIPHCNGTHTECVGHITHERIAVSDCLRGAFVPAVMVSLLSVLRNGEPILSRDELAGALSRVCLPYAQPRALVIRTLPNDESKLSRIYDEHNIPPYFEPGAVELVVERGFTHLLVDLPSIDRLFDEGRLANHRLFWKVSPDSFEIKPGTRMDSTITELIYVPSEVPEGEYLLNLQVAPFESDATPSRPILFPAANELAEEPGDSGESPY